jgi:hypothetical protein
MTRVVFEPKPVDETVERIFDFTSRLSEGESLASAVVTVSVFSGVDADPAAILSGSPRFDGLRVIQDFIAGEEGTTYTVKCQAGTCNGQVASLAAYLAIAESATV